MRSELLIGGEWRQGSEDGRIAVLDPATDEQVAEVADGTPADAIAACDAAEAAQVGWAATAPRVRSEILRNCWQTMIDHTDELASLIVREHGKPMADAKGEIVYAAEFFRWNAEETVRIRGELATAPSGANRIIVHHPPVGVVLMVTPWNFPAAMITRKLAPALGAGNAVVIKPPREAPLTALRIADLLQQAGVPDGLINVVPTSTSGAWFDAAVDHRAVRMLSFTGSTEVGRVLLRRAADRVLKTVMELGGNAPFVVFDDADIDAAVEGAMVAKMRHSAETCTAANRFFVEAGVADEFTAKLAAAMGDVKVGSGVDPGVTCGPLINEEAVDDVDGLVDRRRSRRRHGRGRRLAGRWPGCFYRPTVLGNVPPSRRSPRARSSGRSPRSSRSPTRRDDRAGQRHRDGPDRLRVHPRPRQGPAPSERIQAGMIGLNRGAVSDPAAPFGGMKQSGLGREGCERRHLRVLRNPVHRHQLVTDRAIRHAGLSQRV